MIKQRLSGQWYWSLVVILATLVIVAIALIFRSETAKTEPEVRPKLVRTLIAEKSDERIVISVFGTVQANREVSLRPEVSGRVVEQSDHLVVGGIVEEGEMLLGLDPRDYINLVEQEKAAVERAYFELKVEKGRQVVAEREWEELTPSIKTHELSEELALRKPHLREKEAALVAAQSRLEKAKLDLARTKIKASMNAIVITEAVEVGDYVTPQSEIARIVATDEFRVQVSIPVSKVQWVDIPTDENDEGSAVRIIQDLGNRSMVKKGRVLRLLGSLDPSGRMARLLVAIDDPLGLKDPEVKKLPLLIGIYIRVEIDGPIQKDVFVLPREVLREDNKIWVKNEENQLEIRRVEIVQKREDYVTLAQGLENGEEVVISNLSLPIPGMELRSLDDKETE